MQVQLSIGQTHRFELQEALLIYKGNKQSFITRHPEGFEAMWSELAGKHKPFPSKHLISLPETVGDFVRGSRNTIT